MNRLPLPHTDRALGDSVNANIKELADLKFALDEAAIVARTDHRGIITHVNQRFCEISKYSSEELIGQDHRIINSGYHSKEFIRDLWTTISHGHTWHGELRNRAKDGSLYWVDTTIVPFLDERGKPIQYISIRFDITERKLSEDRIRQQAELLDKTHDAIIVADLSYRIIYWNNGAERMYGWKPAEVLGNSISDVLMLGDTNELNSMRDRFEREGEWKGEVRRSTKDGKKLMAECRWTLVEEDKGHPGYVLIIHTDITEQKRAEDHLLRAQRMESIGTLASGIAHDMNNILSPILLGVDMLQITHTDPETTRWLSLIRENSERGADLVKQVLTFARGMAGDTIPVQVKHVLKELIGILRETLPKSITIKSDIASDLWIVPADPTHIHQVLMNICLNARDAMPNGGTLTIRAQNSLLDENYVRLNSQAAAGGYVLITIEDSGTGMSEETLARIFDPFFTTKDVGMGTGLGLSTASTIVSSQGGFLTVYSELGRGSKFSIYLKADEKSIAEPATEIRSSLPVGRGELILIVDDEQNILEITAATLERFGYRTVSATDGAAALAIFAEKHDDIAAVITDISMPLMDGPALVGALKTINVRTKIIAMTGLMTTDQTSRMESLKVDAVLSKPFAADQLLTVLADVLTS